MFVKITRINEDGREKEILVDTDKIVFVSETEPHICYDKPTKFEKRVDLDTGEEEEVPVEFETQERFLITFDNGRHPQFIDRANYEKLSALLTKQLYIASHWREIKFSLFFIPLHGYMFTPVSFKNNKNNY